MVIQGDRAFVQGTYKELLNYSDVKFRLMPPRRHSKSLVNSKHGVIRSLSLTLPSTSPRVSPQLLALRSVKVSNELYGNDWMSSHEMAKELTKSVVSYPVFAVQIEIVEEYV